FENCGPRRAGAGKPFCVGCPRLPPRGPNAHPGGKPAPREPTTERRQRGTDEGDSGAARGRPRHRTSRPRRARVRPPRRACLPGRMSPAPPFPLALRRAVRWITVALPVVAVLAAVAVLASGAFSAAAEPSWAAAGTLLLVLAGLGAGAARRTPRRAGRERTVGDDLALGAPLVAASVL